MKMRKIVAIVAAVLMLFSVIPFSAMAADGDETIVVKGTTGVLDGTASISWSGTNYEVVNYKDNSTTAIRTSDSDHFRIYVGNEFYVRGKDGALMSQVVINSVSSYLINNTANVVDAGWTVSANGTTITYTAAEPSAELHISIGKQSRIKQVVITPAVASNPECDHSQFTCGDVCDVCGEEFTHAFDNTCDNECNNCSAANPNYAGHVYDGAYDAVCNVCSAEREISYPEANSELTIPEADALGLAMSHNTTTPGKYYVTGVVESIANTTYGNLYIQDENGNKLYIYGTYNNDGTVRFDAMTEKPEVGMTITVYGVIGNYNQASQMKNVWVTEMIGGCEHEYEFECSTTCEVCGKGEREAKCVSDAAYACVDGLCIYCGGDVDALEHDFDDEWDADCNYGCGYTREVEEKPDITEDTLDFSTTDQRTEYSTTVQKWQSNGLVLTNNKGGSTSNVGNYSNPARFYKGSEIIIEYPGMTSLVINAPTGQYGDPWAATLDNAGLTYTVEGGVYTVTFAAPVDSITLTTTAQVRANSMTATAVKKGDDGCAHNWIDATCTEPKTCSICGAVEGQALGHDWEIITQEEATCTAGGSIVYECAACGEDKSETFPVLPHNFVDGICSGCGAELPQKVDKIDDVANLTAGTYYLAGYATGYNGTTVEDWSSYPWHVWIGSVYNGDLETTPYYYSENNGGFGIASTDPTVSGALIELQAVEGKANTYYIVCNAKYLASTANATSRKLALVTEPTEAVPVEWVATANENGGITFSSNGVYMGTGDAASRLIRAYKGESSLKYGVVLFSFDNEAPACEHEYDNACDVDCNLCYETREVTHNVVHVEAKAATCAANGNLEYWYCDVCGTAWLDAECTMNTNLKAVVLPMAEHTYFDACSAICDVCGYEREVSHNIVHVEAEASTCTAEGNIEYWYCDICGAAWLDAECTLNTNLKAVILPATGEHTYDDEYDADCNVCGDVRDVPEKPNDEILYGDADGDGEITLLDAGVLSQYLGGYEVDIDLVAADADGDGEVTLLDAGVLSQYLGGYDVTLGPAEEDAPLFNDGELGGW